MRRDECKRDGASEPIPRHLGIADRLDTNLYADGDGGVDLVYEGVTIPVGGTTVSIDPNSAYQAAGEALQTC